MFDFASSASPSPAAPRPVRSHGRARRGLHGATAAVAVVLGLVLPAAVTAHPLGNFTINHFAALRVATDHVDLDVVIDRAEIPAFQERQRLDTNADGTMQDAELAGQAPIECEALGADLHLAADGAPVPLALDAAGMSFPAGAGGLSTMRLVCEYKGALAAVIGAGTRLTFEDASFAERIGWREIVVGGDAVTIAGRGPGAAISGVSARLTSYPADLLTQPLDQRSIAVEASAGGPALAGWEAPDATPLEARAHAVSTGGALGAVPGGVGQELAAIVNVQDLTPLAILASLGIAVVLGVLHALSPGHGKTIMAAYLVAGRGSSRQAVGLGLAVTVSHTLGVLALAGITLAASSVLPPERLYPVLGVASGGLVIAIGASLLWQRLRASLARRAHAQAHAHGHTHEHERAHAHAHGFAGGHEHPHPQPHGPDAAADSISWRGLLALGLSGGLVPSASALILLLGSIAAGRVAYGLVLVIAFGLGMAIVLAGIGLVLVHARRFVERRAAGGVPLGARLRRLVAAVQLATAGLVVALGIVLTGQALTQVL
jgi:ABC-type nickel/cobalt efflux system permease component RcnA